MEEEVRPELPEEEMVRDIVGNEPEEPLQAHLRQELCDELEDPDPDGGEEERPDAVRDGTAEDDGAGLSVAAVHVPARSDERGRAGAAGAWSPR